MRIMSKCSAVGIIAAILLIISAIWHSIANKNLLYQPQPQSQSFQQGFLKGINIPENKYLQAKLMINGYALTADIAGTPKQQMTGLAIKFHLNEDQAMLFPFPVPSLEGFWMKDMRFPIDIMWIDSNNTIVHIESNLQPCIKGAICPIYSPPIKVIYVLETVAGFSQRHHVIVGQTQITALQLLIP